MKIREAFLKRHGGELFGRECSTNLASTRLRSNVLTSAEVFLLTLLTFSLLPLTCSYAATRTVCNSGCGYTTIAAAISSASAGDTISITDVGHTESNITV